MTSLLDALSPADLRTDPFPHLVARDLLPADRIAQLIDEFPPLAAVTGGRAPGNNQRFSLAADKALRDPRVSAPWRALIAAHLTQGFLERVLQLFAPAIAARYPALAARGPTLAARGPALAARGPTLGPGLRAGVRRRDGFGRADVLLEAQVSVNTPVTMTTSVRGPHVDMPDKLFAGLFYLRHPADDSTGGALQLYRWRGRPVLDDGQFVAADAVEPVATLDYQSNLLVLFLNGIDAVHGVTPRAPTPYPRLFLNLFGELPRPLFDLQRYQRDRSLARRARWAWQLTQKRLVHALPTPLLRRLA